MTEAAAVPAEGAMFDMQAAPLHVGRVRLRVRDLSRVAEFYESLLGLRRLDQGAGWTLLGTPAPGGGARPLLELVGDARLAPRDPRQAGLFHTAFLMPSRADLGRRLPIGLHHLAAGCRRPRRHHEPEDRRRRFLERIGVAGARLEGASDHLVSEAIYLSDPEGAGIEVYADRPEAAWRTPSGAVKMATLPLDAQALYEAGGGAPYASAPEGLIVGHVHLQVGDTRAADRFYRDVLGFDLAAEYPGASFYGSGGYHHQLAGNVWNSRGAGPRPAGMAGLETVELIARDAAVRDAALARAEAAGLAPEARDGRTALRDPWGGLTVLAV